MHILALSARDAANWLAARRLSCTCTCTCACRVSAARAVRAARLQNGTAALWWDVNHHSKSSLFCPLCVSVATVSYHLEVPHPPDPSNGFSPPSYSFDFGLPCFVFFCSLLHVAFSLEALILSPYCFICFPLYSFFFCPFSFYSLLPFALFFFQSFSLRVFSSSICGFYVLCSLTSEVIHIHDPLDKHFISYCACRHTDVHKGA